MLELDIGIVGDVAAALRELRDAEASRVAVAALGDESGFKRQKAAVALRGLRDPKTRAVVLARAIPEATVAFLAGATANGFARVYLGLHDTSDVIAGAIIGVAAGRALCDP